MMLTTTLLVITLTAAATAITPPGFQPSSTQDLIVAFGNTLAVNGQEMPKAETANPPVIGTSKRLAGTYAVMMVDPDIPPQTSGGPTSEFLHWMQAGLTSLNTTTTIGGQTFYELVATSNSTAIASYIQPSPPDAVPHTHRYTQLLLQVGNRTALQSLTKAGATRGSFSATNVVKGAGLAVLAGNSFDVTNSSSSTGTGAAATKSGLMQNNATKTIASGIATATGATRSNTTTPISIGTLTGTNGGDGTLMAMVVCFAVAMVML